MTDPARNGKPRKSWPRSARLALYAAVLLALLLWMQHENRASDALKPAPAEASSEQPQKAKAENRRAKAASELVKNAASSRDRAEKIRIYCLIA